LISKKLRTKSVSNEITTVVVERWFELSWTLRSTTNHVFGIIPNLLRDRQNTTSSGENAIKSPMCSKKVLNHQIST
jgi:hypothetical protein